MKQQYNKLQFIKNKQINVTTKQQYIWEKFLEPSLGKFMFFKEHPRKKPQSRHCSNSRQLAGKYGEKEKCDHNQNLLTQIYIPQVHVYH